jgi:hypothetical protein
MATPQSTGNPPERLQVTAPLLTAEQLQGIFKKALNDKVAPPSIEVCGDLVPMLAGLRQTNEPDWAGGEQLGPQARNASVTLRNRLPEVEDYWRRVFADWGSSPQAQGADHIARRLAALRAALDDCDGILGPMPKPHTERWDDFVVLVEQAFDEGMAGSNKNFGLWIESPRIVFVHSVIEVLGWSVEPAAVLKNLDRAKDKSP